MRKKTVKKAALAVLSLGLMIAGLASWQQVSYSQEADAGAIGQNKCRGDNGKDEQCCVAYRQGISTAKSGWNEVFEDIRAQEKPASEITVDAFESLRSYECQLRYICSAVRYSGVNHILSVRGTGITSKHMETIPGCQAPEELNMTGDWASFVQTLREVPLIGAAAEALPAELYQSSRITYIPQCMTNPNANNEPPELTVADQRYVDCLEAVNDEMGLRVLAVQQGMNQTHAGQRSRVMEKKLYDIVNRLQGTQEVASFMETQLNSLANRYLCAPPKCT